MSAVISCLNLKGGSGKTTICINLAAALAKFRRRVILLDLDPQESATRWAAQADMANTNHLYKFDLRRDVHPIKLDNSKPAKHFKTKIDLLAAEVGADIVLIDNPPEITDPALIASLLSDLVLIPTTPSPLDIWAAEVAVNTARDARQQRGGKLPMIYLIPSRLITGTVLAREITETLISLGEPVAPSIYQRVALIEAAMVGETIVTYAPKSSAFAEFKNLAKHVLEMINNV